MPRHLKDHYASWTGHFGMASIPSAGRALALAIIFSMNGFTAHGLCQDSTRVQLPKHWVLEHHAGASYESCGLPWFGDLLDGIATENPRVPTGIAFYGFAPTDEKLDLHELSRFDGLRCLAVFDGDRLSRNSWRNIAERNSLRALIVPTADLDDRTLQTLSSLCDVVALDVSMTDITDNSIETLASFRQLAWVNISGTKMTLRGAERLRVKMPKCAVELDRWRYGERSLPTWRNEILELDAAEADADK